MGIVRPAGWGIGVSPLDGLGKTYSGVMTAPALAQRFKELRA